MTNEIDQYDEMTVKRLNAMTPEERGNYYHTMYQYAGRLFGVLAEVDSYNSLNDSAEHFMYGAAGNAHAALMDALAALESAVEQ